MPKRARLAVDDDLNAEQRRAVEWAREGRNLFLTGPPGAGKTHTLHRIVAALEDVHGRGAVLKTATTGAAALLLGGQTLASAPGPGVPSGTVSKFHQMRKRWNKAVKAVVIDEVSMLDAEFFDWYYEALPAKAKPQLVLCGDFFQLPPVGRADHSLEEHLEYYMNEADGDSGGDPKKKKPAWETTPFGLKETTGKFAFQAAAWRLAKMHTVQLTHVYRTSDPTLLDAQRAIREGRADDAAVRTLVERASRPLEERADGIRPTEIMPLKRAVEVANMDALYELDKATAHTYDASDDVRPVRAETASWLRSDGFFKYDCPAVPKLELRLGAQVMLLRNESKDVGTLVNGSRGIVTGFAVPPPKYDGGEYVADESVTLDEYAAPHAAKTEYPIVKFVSGETRLVTPHEFVKDVFGKGTCVRFQLPLALASAITVHKTQGATLDCVRVDLAGTFCEGQAYVALSRARTLEGLEIRNFTPQCIKTSAMVRGFYDAVARGDEREYVEDLWWGKAVLETAEDGWRALYGRHPAFATWARHA
jgi:ATP-dependent DNA helicase PIF1